MSDAEAPTTSLKTTAMKAPHSANVTRTTPPMIRSDSYSRVLDATAPSAAAGLGSAPTFEAKLESEGAPADSASMSAPSSHLDSRPAFASTTALQLYPALTLASAVPSQSSATVGMSFAPTSHTSSSLVLDTTFSSEISLARVGSGSAIASSAAIGCDSVLGRHHNVLETSEASVPRTGSLSAFSSAPPIELSSSFVPIELIPSAGTSSPLTLLTHEFQAGSATVPAVTSQSHSSTMIRSSSYSRLSDCVAHPAAVNGAMLDHFQPQCEELSGAPESESTPVVRSTSFSRLSDCLTTSVLVDTPMLDSAYSQSELLSQSAIRSDSFLRPSDSVAHLQSDLERSSHKIPRIHQSQAIPLPSAASLACSSPYSHQYQYEACTQAGMSLYHSQVSESAAIQTFSSKAPVFQEQAAPISQQPDSILNLTDCLPGQHTTLPPDLDASSLSHFTIDRAGPDVTSVNPRLSGALTTAGVPSTSASHPLPASMYGAHEASFAQIDPYDTDVSSRGIVAQVLKPKAQDFPNSRHCFASSHLDSQVHPCSSRVVAEVGVPTISSSNVLHGNAASDAVCAVPSVPFVHESAPAPSMYPSVTTASHIDDESVLLEAMGLETPPNF